MFFSPFPSLQLHPYYTRELWNPQSYCKLAGGESRALRFHILARSTARFNIIFMRATKNKKKPEKKSVNQRPEVRTLKIQPNYRKNKYEYVTVAEIRLCGNWLQKLGFCQKQRVTITAMKELIIVRPAPENSV